MLPGVDTITYLVPQNDFETHNKNKNKKQRKQSKLSRQIVHATMSHVLFVIWPYQVHEMMHERYFTKGQWQN